MEWFVKASTYAQNNMTEFFCFFFNCRFPTISFFPSDTAYCHVNSCDELIVGSTSVFFFFFNVYIELNHKVLVCSGSF